NENTWLAEPGVGRQHRQKPSERAWRRVKRRSPAASRPVLAHLSANSAMAEPTTSRLGSVGFVWIWGCAALTASSHFQAHQYFIMECLADLECLLCKCPAFKSRRLVELDSWAVVCFHT